MSKKWIGEIFNKESKNTTTTTIEAINKKKH